MASNSDQLSGQFGLDTPEKIRDLFKRCTDRQQWLDRLNVGELKEFFGRQVIFAEPQFPPAPTLDRADLLIWKGQLYDALVHLLKAAPDLQSLWYWLAQWLHSEDIRVPPEILQQLTSVVRLSAADIRNAYVVRIWLPYTEPLLRKSKWLLQHDRKNLSKRLRDLGYDPAAVDLVTEVSKGGRTSWRSPVEFTCEWVASRTLDTKTEYQRQTLRNSYSRFLGRRRVRLSTCSFCEKPADSEFWVHGLPIVHCKEHAADSLPATENLARLDRFGRPWWCEDFEIRCLRYTRPAVSGTHRDQA